MIAARALGLAVALAGVLGLAWASRMPLRPDPDGTAMLRVAWSARPERIEECRKPSADEQAALPQHMRQDLVCEGRPASYRLEVRVNGALRVQQVVRGGGWRRDRRLYVFRELRVAPGDVRLDVRFTREGDAPPPAASPARIEFVAPRLELQEVVRLARREVVLVTYDAERRALVARQRGRPPEPDAPVVSTRPGAGTD